MKSVWFVAALAAVTAFTAMPSQAQTLERIRQTQTLTISYRPNSAPFSYLIGPQALPLVTTAEDKRDDKIAPVGYSIDLCQRVAEVIRKNLGLKKLDIKYVSAGGNAAARLKTIQDGKADIECANTTNRADRRELVGFTVPHFIGGARAMTKTGEDIRHVDSLKGKRVAVIDGEAHMFMLEEQNTRGASMRITKVKSVKQAHELLDKGEVDVWVNDDVRLFELRAESPKPSDFTISSRVMTIEPLGLMLRKGDTEFADMVNNELKAMMRRGDVIRIYNKWFKSKIPPKGINLDFSASVLLHAYLTVPSTELPVSLQ